MEWSALLLVAGMAVLAVAFIARPLIEGRAQEPGEADRRLSALYAERDQTLSLLHELDMDFAMEKVTPEDYQAQRAERVRRGADVLREIDELEPSAPAAGGTPLSAAELEEQIARLRERAAGFCAECGHPIVVGDRFCSKCGHPTGGAAG